MKEAFEGKHKPCFENFGASYTETENCECCLDLQECEKRTFQLKQPFKILQN